MNGIWGRIELPSVIHSPTGCGTRSILRTEMLRTCSKHFKNLVVRKAGHHPSRLTPTREEASSIETTGKVLARRHGGEHTVRGRFANSTPTLDTAIIVQTAGVGPTGRDRDKHTVWWRGLAFNVSPSTSNGAHGVETTGVGTARTQFCVATGQLSLPFIISPPAHHPIVLIKGTTVGVTDSERIKCACWSIQLTICVLAPARNGALRIESTRMDTANPNSGPQNRRTSGVRFGLRNGGIARFIHQHETASGHQ